MTVSRTERKKNKRTPRRQWTENLQFKGVPLQDSERKEIHDRGVST